MMSGLFSAQRGDAADKDGGAGARRAAAACDGYAGNASLQGFRHLDRLPAAYIPWRQWWTRRR